MGPVQWASRFFQACISHERAHDLLLCISPTTTLTFAGTPWRKEQTRDLQQVLGEVDRDIPLVFVSGNHDLGNVPTAETVEEYRSTWGDDYFSFWVGGVLFLVLNSQFLFDASQCPALKQAQDQWLEQQLSLARQRRCLHAIVFQHIPLFLQSVDEDDDYFNLTKHVRQEMADKFIEAGTAPRVLAQIVIWSGGYRSARVAVGG